MRRDDDGAAVIWVVCACLLIWTAAMGFVTLGSAVVARHRAATAADLAALGAAQRLLAGGTRPCETASAVVAAHGGRLVECAVGSASVHVVAELPVARTLVRLPPARAQARAGP